VFQFGTGYLFGNPNAQNLATDPTPQFFGTVQEIGLEFGATIKELRGNLQFPDDTAIADKKLSGKVSFGRIETTVFNQLFFADSFTSGVTAIQPFEPHTIPATPFQVTIAPPGSGTFILDLGVRYTTTFFPLTKVASGPTIGQYSVNLSTGVYTFAAADTAAGVQISYTYSSTAGNTMTVNNQLQGYGPQFEMWLDEPYAGTGNGIHIYACKAGKLNAPLKRDDYQIIEMDFEAFANPSNNTNPSGRVFDWFQTST
jgi:hypothetical protein